MSKYWSKIVVLIVGLLCAIFLFSAGRVKAKNLFESKIHNDVMVRVRGKVCEGLNMTSLQKTSQLSPTRYSLGGTGFISGYVKDEDGNPIDNVWFNLNESDDPYWAGSEAWNWVDNTNTSYLGYYEFTGLTERQYHIHFYHPQDSQGIHYVDTDMYNVQVFEGAETPNINFTLRRAGRIWGYIKTSAGDPIPYARVVANCSYTEDGTDWHQTNEVSSLGIYELWLLPSSGKFYPVHVQQALTPGTMYKVYGGSQYIDGENALNPEAHGYTLLGTGTGTDTFNGDDSYDYYIIIAEPGYLTKVDAVEGSNNNYYGIDSGGDIDGWGNVNGEPDGQYASINYRQNWDDEGGYILVEPDPNNTSLTVHIRNDGRTNTDPIHYEAKVDPGLYQATLDGVRGPDFFLNESGRIHGRVVNENGVGIADVEIDPSVGMIDDPDAFTDANGYYTLVSVPVTDHAYAYIDLWGQAVAQDEVKYARGRQHVGPFTITPGVTVEAPDMTVLVAGTLKGQVTDENGVPIAGAEVEVNGHDEDGYESGQDEVYTDAFGQYTIDYLAPGTYNVSAEKSGWMMGRKSGVVITSGNLTDCDLVMKSPDQAAVVSGKITNYDAIKPKDVDGIPLPLYDEGDYDEYGIRTSCIFAVSSDVEYTDQDYLDLGGSSFVGMTDPDDGYDDYFQDSNSEIEGSYSFILPPGNVDVCIGFFAAADSCFSVVFDDWKRLSLTAGSELSNQNLTASTTLGTLKGDISAPTGCTLKRTIIAVFNQNNIHAVFPDAVAMPEVGSTYSIGQMPVGTYTVRAISDGYATQVYQNIVVNQDAVTTRDILFGSGGTLSGNVMDDANSIAGAVVKIEENGKTSVTTALGSYAITGLNSGNYTVTITKSGYATLEQAITIIDGQTTTEDFTLDSSVGSIEGTVKNANGENVNGATVVAYNTTDATHKQETTVGGIFKIEELIPGEYLLAVNADGYGVTVYPDTGTIPLGESEALTDQNIVLVTFAPEFTVSSTVSDDTPPKLSMVFFSDVDLVDDPNFSIITGDGTLSDPNKVSDSQFTINYAADSNDIVVEIEIEGTSNGMSGGKIFSFEVSSDITCTTTTNITNAVGGDLTMMGVQDNTKVSVPPFALAGADDTTAVALTIERYGDPGENVEGTNDQSVSAVYDFCFEDGNVSIAENHSITVTMSFELPAGMTHQEFENTFEVRYFNVNIQQWQTDGISNTKINWNNFTITFDVNHLSKFAAFIQTDEALKPHLLLLMEAAAVL